MATTNFGWITPALGAENNVPADLAGLAQQVDTTVNTIATPPICRIYQTANQSIASGVTSTLTCTLDFNLGGFGNGAGSWARTVPVAGFYRIAAQAFWGRPASGSGYGRVEISQGATILAMSEGGLSVTTYDLSVLAEVIVQLAAGAEIAFKVRHTAPGSVTCMGGDKYRTWMSIEYLRGA